MRKIGLIAALAGVYIVAGRLGLSLDPVGGFATLVWPPAGISLAALLVFGPALWPGILLGALLVNVLAGAPFGVALAIAGGNTLEAVVGADVLRRVGFDPLLSRVRHVIGLALLAAAGATLIAATVGVAALIMGDIVALNDAGHAWIAWWLGDATGILALTPLLLLVARGGGMRMRPRWGTEAAALAGGLALMSWIIFTARSGGSGAAFWHAYLLAPLLMWAALRFHQIGAVASMLLVSSIALWGTTKGLGPFTAEALHVRLEYLQAFMAVTTLTFLVLGVLAAERAAAENALRLAKEEAEAASQAKSRFLAVTSHELRTPLTGIVGYADLLSGDIGGPLNETQRGHVERINAMAWHLASIIESILSFTRADSGREEINVRDSDAVALARDAIAVVQPTARDKGLQIVLQAPDHPVDVRTDPAKVSQILLNLLGNAVKFTDTGRIELRVGSDDVWVTLVVSDNGPGISSEYVDHIFEPFTQIDQTATRIKGGVGLGLSVARTFAQMLGGTLSVTSTVGAGSTFTLRLPQTEKSDAQS
jgi:signal transduction histidine kinase